MESYSRFFEYVKQSNKLVYDYYASHAQSCLCIYFNINKEQSIYDNDKLDGGSYEFYGSASGIRYTKIMLLPVYFVEPIQPTYSAEERGYIHETTGSIVIPSSYNIIPYEHDLVYFPSELNPSTKYPVYEVIGIEKSTDTQVTMWKCNIRSARTSYNVIDDQVVETKVWFEPTKTILSAESALNAYKLMDIKTRNIEQLKGYYHVSGLFIF